MTTTLTANTTFFGARAEDGGARFALWAPAAESVTLVVESGACAGEYQMARAPDGLCTLELPGVAAGDLYRFRLGDSPLMPDPASRFQPMGVHGPSEVIDPTRFAWTDAPWRGIDVENVVTYELHVGTFTPEGTFASAIERLPYLRDLGVTVVELMPVADFAGERNWGYDGVCLFAPSRAYGRPDDLRRFVNAAHGHGLAVLLDVVYNHLGPDGAYMSTFAPAFFTPHHPSAWGDGVNLDGPESGIVRRFLADNAVHWLREYHLDGLRLDATHALTDDSAKHVVVEIVEAGRAASERPVMIVAEDHHNKAAMLRTRAEQGWDLDGVWADDFHHIMRRILAGDAEGYYEDFEASVEDLTETIRRGWFYTGQYSRYLGQPRGSVPSGIPRRKFVVCVQNHDQVGNRAFGDRLNHAIDGAAYRAASAVLLLAPETPLLFMGQEWAASTPFRYFTDHTAELGKLIVEGRRREFAKFSDFVDPELRSKIPSPQDPETFEASKLRWEEREKPPHDGTLRLYQRLLALRRRALGLAPSARDEAVATALDADTLLIRYAGGASHLWAVARLRRAGAVDLPELPRGARVVLSTEDAEFAVDGRVPRVWGSRVRFDGPAAVVIGAWQ
ncbi:MAG TPA: malto-oligosyltrehalose trehalohydrolase [Vicinamibacterales bacterium]|nr:malto-oligosyltrehalose trehalohydrolase [Vicinamibacterales bacterium]